MLPTVEQQSELNVKLKKGACGCYFYFFACSDRVLLFCILFAVCIYTYLYKKIQSSVTIYSLILFIPKQQHQQVDFKL